MPPVGFEPTISAGEQPQTYALDRAATGTGQTKPIVYHRENRHLNVVQKAGWVQESVQTRKDDRNVLPPKGIEPRLQLRPTYNHTKCAILSLVIHSVLLQHTPSPNTHPRTPLLSYMQYMTKNNTYTVWEKIDFRI